VASWRRTAVTLMTMRFNGLKNWPWWGEKRESLVYKLYVRDGNKEKRRQKASIDPGCTSLLDSEDLKVVSTDQAQIHDGWLHSEFQNNLAHTFT
jgi:hypothetical protein